MGAHGAGGFASGYSQMMAQMLPIVEQGKRHREQLDLQKRMADAELKFMDVKLEAITENTRRHSKLLDLISKGVEQPTESAPEFGMATGQAAPPSTFREPTNEDVMALLPPHTLEQMLVQRMTQQPKDPKFITHDGNLLELPTQPGGTPRVAMPGTPADKGPKFMSGPGGSIVELPEERGGQPRIALPGADPKAAEPLTPEGKRIADAERIFGKGSPQHKAAVEAFGAAPDNPAKLTNISELRKEFTKQSGDFITQRDAFSRIKAVGEKPSAAGDVALIFGFMKLLDPGSTVREGEFATAQNSVGIPDKIKQMYHRALSGERLPPAQRADFVNQANVIFGAALGRHAQTEEQYKRQAQYINVDPRQVVVDFIGDLRGKPTNAPNPPAAPAAVTDIGIPPGFRRVP
jgi:hypothetical protein